MPANSLPSSVQQSMTYYCAIYIILYMYKETVSYFMYLSSCSAKSLADDFAS